MRLTSEVCYLMRRCVVSLESNELSERPRSALRDLIKEEPQRPHSALRGLHNVIPERLYPRDCRAPRPFAQI